MFVTLVFWEFNYTPLHKGRVILQLFESYSSILAPSGLEVLFLFRSPITDRVRKDTESRCKKALLCSASKTWSSITLKAMIVLPREIIKLGSKYFLKFSFLMSFCLSLKY